MVQDIRQKTNIIYHLGKKIIGSAKIMTANDIIYVVPFIFLFIAFVFSMLGMGGSQLYIPILFWFGLDFKAEAIPLGLLLNILNSSSSAITYGRKRMISWRIGIPFAITMIIFAPIGTLINVSLPVEPVILIFALFTMTAASLMLSGWKPKHEIENRSKWIIGFMGGGLLGFFTGLIGRGGGSFIVPIFYIIGLAPKIAAATSAFVVTCSGISGFISHLVTAAQPNWLLWLTSAIAVIIGSQLGSRLMSEKLKPKRIKYIFGFVLLGVSAIMILQTFF
ncbi:MAG: sulfite exporter TauE/SafE family protein [Promethearchaeota archaeon]